MGFITKAIPIVLAALSTVDGAKILEAGPHAETIPNKYIVVMKQDVSHEAFNAHATWVGNNFSRRPMRRGGSFKPMAGMQHKFSLGGTFKAYTGEFDEAMIKDISNHDDVDFIERDTVVKATAITQQDNVPSWGLARVGSKEAGGSTYYYDDTAGKGVTAYIIDTGIDIHHGDFGGRAKWGKNFVDKMDEDCNGHGSHVAGTVGGTKFGVAKGVNLVAVKVLDCEGSGSNSGVIMGMEWAMKEASGGGNSTAKAAGKSVMNMSLGGPRSEASNKAAKAIADAGIFMAVAAGNDNMDAQHSSPASEPSICTVAASSEDDSKADFSNYGAVVDIYAPGNEITSVKPGNGTDTLSGTSMASPHVCGLGAYLIGLGKEGGPGLCDTIKEMATDAIKNPGEGTTGKLIYNGSGK
ncbi:proteinase K [Nannizzia gypsea CBS 118893]|uniref:Subtilisin-like protease 6 n=1 Tax=Arthroderma gypseum (strain ATCC MYA-4604 / CBS 118893) TaxID=535722 RepID=SUB6_ARTGP|nr:proteinase K [Nannizzia gypsea CBS 118893]E4V4J8.1 RecName: Full=Subtilisin-like protease 6; Flags: Precursor [Nannizzia gypsea CBS 118893]EFR04922.1 proteinase K [Nannizzia gypsea CBS 118893]